MNSPIWYVVHTHPNGEARAEHNLRRQGFHTYLPRYLRRTRHARKTQLVPRPLFPRYVFVALDLFLSIGAHWISAADGTANSFDTHFRHFFEAERVFGTA